MMTHILKACLVLLVANSAFAAESCPTLEDSSPCKCKYGVYNEGAGVKVECKDITDTDTLYKEIQKFSSYHIDYLKLIRLDLPYLPAGLFSGVSVTRLYIENSKLKNLYSVENASPSPFQGLEDSLKEVHVKDTTEPSKWYWLSMKNFKNLRKFIFSNSPLNFVGHVFAEIGDGSLEVIAARHSKVERIHPQAFPEMTNILSADFEGNHLVYLVRTMFPNPAPRLEILNFRDNHLFTLNENMFENMPALIFLDISGNQFKHFENVVFSPLWNQLQFLFVAGNPYECGCGLLPLKERLQSKSLSQDLKDVTCINHGQFKKTKLKDLDFNSLKCY